MTHENDPVDAALAALRDRQWNRPHHRARLEEKLMNEFAPRSNQAPRSSTRTIAIGVLALAGVALAAAGGAALVRSWTVTTKVNGEVVDTRIVTPDASGTSRFSVSAGERGTANVEVKEGAGGQKQVMVEMPSTGSGSQTTTIEIGERAAEKNGQ